MASRRMAILTIVSKNSLLRWFFDFWHEILNKLSILINFWQFHPNLIRDQIIGDDRWCVLWHLLIGRLNTLWSWNDWCMFPSRWHCCHLLWLSKRNLRLIIEKIDYVLTINLQWRYFGRKFNIFRLLSSNLILNQNGCSRQNTSLFIESLSVSQDQIFNAIWWTFHRVCLASSCLSIGKETHILSIDCRLNETAHPVKYLDLLRRRIKNSIEQIPMLALSHLTSLLLHECLLWHTKL